MSLLEGGIPNVKKRPSPAQVFAEFLLAARLRAKRRHSPWNLILIPLTLGCWLAVWFALFRLTWALHVWLYPDHLFRNFWQAGISFPSFFLSFLMLFALMPAALCLGFVIANCIAWLIPPARRVFDAEAKGYPGTSFPEANAALLRLSLWTVPIGLGLSVFAASLLRSLR